MDFAGLIAALRRRWIVVLLCVVAGTAGGYYLGHHGAKTYQATSQSFVSLPTAHSLNDQALGTQLASNYTQTYARIATSIPVAQLVVDQLGLDESAQSVRNSLSASAEQNTFIIDITATADSAVLAKQLADAAASGLQTEVRQLDSGQPLKVQALVLQPAPLPTSPVSPKPTFNLVVGILLGLVVGIGAAALMETLDRTIKSTAAAEEAMAAPMLALVPRRSQGSGIVVGPRSRSSEGEPYRSLRTSLRFIDPDHPLRSLLVTSATPNDGKSTTAANLALAMALSGENVVLVDADLRRGGLGRLLGLESAVGLTSVILGQHSLTDSLQSYGRDLRVLTTGPLPPNPSEILGSQVFNQLLDELKRIADIVIVDAPPVLPVADALALAVQTDGVLLIARHSATQRTAATEARRRLDAVGAKVIGHVLNAVPPSASRGYYADYSYEYTQPQPQQGS